jgi:hypothetical protein
LPSKRAGEVAARSKPLPQARSDMRSLADGEYFCHFSTEIMFLTCLQIAALQDKACPYILVFL